MEAPLSEPFFTRRMKMLSRPDDFTLYGKLGVDFFYTSELLYSNMKIRLGLIGARPYFYMISDNPNVSLRIVDCSLYTGRTAVGDDFHKERMDMLAYAPVEFNYMETLANTFIIPARQNQFIQENINNAPVRQIAIAMKKNTALTGSYTKPLNILFRLNSLISEKLEYSELFNQLSLLLLQINVAFMLRQ